MIERATLLDAFDRVRKTCDPAKIVRLAIIGTLGGTDVPRGMFGLSIGKAGLAMARGAGPVIRGVIVAPHDDGLGVPSGWTLYVGSHPEPDEYSVAAADAVIDLLASARVDDRVLALISGGASSLIERVEPGVSLGAFRTEIRRLMERGAPIEEINRHRIAKSMIKGGKLAQMCDAPIVTLAMSDVVGDELAVIGSGPTIAGRPGDLAKVIAPLNTCATAMVAALKALAFDAVVEQRPIVGDVETLARILHVRLAAAEAQPPQVLYGEPTVVVPATHGDGGRMQQLALELARLIHNTSSCALAIGTDGMDGPPPPGRPAPAGAYVDGTTWDAILAAGIDPNVALERRDAGTALAAVGALVITGPTGINHADLVVIG